MATTAQIHANRANARHSTGPRTADGKAASALNALKHGLRSQKAVLPDENINDFYDLLDALEDQFQPATAIEWTLLRQLADAEWRMRRVPHIEAGLLARQLHKRREHYQQYPEQLPDDPVLAETCVIGAMAHGDAVDGDVLSRLSRYEARLSHRYFKALEHLQQAQKCRNKQAAPPPQAPPRKNPTPKNGQTNPIPTSPPPPQKAANPQNPAQGRRALPQLPPKKSGDCHKRREELSKDRHKSNGARLTVPDFVPTKVWT